MISLDLRAFGPIGFQDFYLERQGYKGKNLLKLIADRCFDINLDFCAITSCAEYVVKGSVHDRFGYLIKLAGSMPKEYDIDILERAYGREREPTLVIIKKDNKRTVLINSHAVLCKVGDKRVDHMIIGSNQIPSYTIQPWEKNINKLRELGWVIGYARDRDLVQTALHPFAHQVHNSVGNFIEPYLNDISAIEGQCSEFFLENPNSPFSKKQDELAKKFAKKHKKPWIAVSAAHRIEDIGLSYITTEKELRLRSANAFLEDLDNILRQSNFKNKIGYQTEEGLKSWFGDYNQAIKKRIEENYECDL